MQFSFLGRLNKVNLPDRHALLPVFEALTNSLDSVEDRVPAGGSIRIVIRRDVDELDLEAHGNSIAPIRDFEIIDDGRGFTDFNMVAFETVDTTAKAARGGKGIGRLSWLKAFEYAEVRSQYEQDGSWEARSFEFRPTQQGIEAREDEGLEGAPPGGHKTSIRLVGLKERYRSAMPKSADAIARRIIEHSLEVFLLLPNHSIVLDDPDGAGKIDLRQMFRDVYRPEENQREFQIDGVTFRILDVLLKPDSDSKHHLHFCANGRSVVELPLAGKIPHLDSKIEGPDGQLVYAGYVTSNFLDETVSPERVSFEIDSVEALPLAESDLTWERIHEGTLQEVSEWLGPQTEEARKRSWERIESYVSEERPQYRILLSRRPEQVARISGSLSDERLDAALHRIQSAYEGELREKAMETLRDLEAGEIDGLEAVKQRLGPILDALHETAKGKLVEYVFHRRSVLEFFRSMLDRQSDDRFALEAAVHELLFPQFTTSDEVRYEEHNLWLLDERLAFHQFLSSDKELRSDDVPLDSDSQKRPDLLIFNRKLAFSEDIDEVGSVILVEFKRPERADYSDEDNPIKQVYDYVQLLRDGKGKTAGGGTLRIPSTVPFYCFIVATLNPKLVDQAEAYDMIEAPHGGGYFDYHRKRNAYIELLDYRKVYGDAVKRNRIFFEKLGIPPR